MLNDLIIGKEYKRKDLHKKFGGQPQGGISTPVKFPIIFIFTNPDGKKYGYADEWQDDLFYYSGEGQSGDMEWKRGNVAIRDHVEDEKYVLLFNKISQGNVKLIAELRLVRYEYISAPDINEKNRKAIQFIFEKVGLSKFS